MWCLERKECSELKIMINGHGHGRRGHGLLRSTTWFGRSGTSNINKSRSTTECQKKSQSATWNVGGGRSLIGSNLGGLLFLIYESKRFALSICP
jgi:hypothetical protein